MLLMDDASDLKGELSTRNEVETCSVGFSHSSNVLMFYLFLLCIHRTYIQHVLHTLHVVFIIVDVKCIKSFEKNLPAVYNPLLSIMRLSLLYQLRSNHDAAPRISTASD